MGLRSFIALPVPALGPLLRVQAALDVGRAVAPENWHVTLAYLGAQSVPVLRDLDERLSAVRAPPFAMRIAGLDVVGGATPRLIAATIDAPEPMRRLRRKVRQAVRQAGIALAHERFRPHVTLARFPRQMGALELRRIAGVLEAHGAVDAGVAPVEGFTLYRSILTPDGARYEPLADYPLRG